MGSSIQSLFILRDKASVIALDIYQFPYVNEHLGFTIQDEPLKSIAKSLQGLLKEDDFIGRVSVDEFLLFISGINSRDLIYPSLNSIIDYLSNIFSTVCSIPSKFDLGITVYLSDRRTLKNLYQKAKVTLDFTKRMDQTKSNSMRMTRKIISKKHLSQKNS